MGDGSLERVACRALPRQRDQPMYSTLSSDNSAQLGDNQIQSETDEVDGLTPQVFVPYVHPDSGGTQARVLVVLESPAGPAALGSGMLSADSNDETAKNIWRADEPAVCREHMACTGTLCLVRRQRQEERRGQPHSSRAGSAVPHATTGAPEGTPLTRHKGSVTAARRTFYPIVLMIRSFRAVFPYLVAWRPSNTYLV